MAKVIIEDNSVFSHSLQAWLRVIGFGAVVGLAYWILTLLIGNYVVEPLACRDIATATTCVGAESLAGKISTVLIAVAAIFGMVRLGVVRPIIIALASAALLWELSAWVEGLFWLESLAWSVLLYAVSYALFGWIVRALSVVVAIIIAVLAVVALRILLAL